MIYLHSWMEKLTKKYVDRFVFLLLYIYRRHLLQPVRKICRIPNFPLIYMYRQKYYHLFKQNGLSAHIEKIHITWSYSIKILVNIWNHGKKLQDLQGQNHWKILADIYSIFLFNFFKFKLISHISSSLLLFCLIFCILCCWLQSHSDNILSKKEALLPKFYYLYVQATFG